MRKLLLLTLFPAVVCAQTPAAPPGGAAPAAASVPTAVPTEALQPMAFLAGHCWKGTFADGKTTDEHCFEWMYNGKFLRDRHVVKNPGNPEHTGETFYFWDGEAKQVQYVYLEDSGGISRGAAEAAADGLFFPSARYSDGKTAMTYRSRWTRVEPDAYEAHAEAQTKDGWATMFKMKLAKQPKG